MSGREMRIGMEFVIFEEKAGSYEVLLYSFKTSRPLSGVMISPLRLGGVYLHVLFEFARA